MGYRQFAFRVLATFVNFFTNDVIAQIDALVTDKNRGAGDQLPDLVLALAAKRAIEQLFVLILGFVVTHN
jgi:hypothetical protein